MSTLISWEILSFLCVVYCLPQKCTPEDMLKGMFLEYSEQFKTECVLFLNPYIFLQMEKSFHVNQQESSRFNEQCSHFLRKLFFIDLSFLVPWTARTVVHTRTKAPIAGSKDPQAPPRLQLCGRTVIGAVSQFVGTSHTDLGASCHSAQLCMRGAVPTLYRRLWPNYAVYQTRTLGIDHPRNPLSPSSH